MLGAISSGSDERKGDRGGCGSGQLDLCLLSGFGQALKGLTIIAEINALSSLEITSKPVDNALIEIITTKMGISRGRKYLKDTITDLEDGNIKGTTTKIEYKDSFIRLLV